MFVRKKGSTSAGATSSPVTTTESPQLLCVVLPGDR